MPTIPSVGYFDSYQHCNAIRCNPVGLSGTTWDTNTLLTWANMNHMGHYAPIWDTKPAGRHLH